MKTFELSTVKERVDEGWLPLEDYNEYLNQANAKYRDTDNHYLVGDNPTIINWVVYLSFRLQCASDFLHNIIPFLVEAKAAFWLIKDNVIHNKYNGGAMGASEVGKNITVFCENSEMVVLIQRFIEQKSMPIDGPVVKNSLRIGRNIYVHEHKLVKVKNADGEQNCISLSIPQSKSIPFKIAREYKKSKESRIIGKWYVPVEVVSDSWKGRCLKAILIKNFAFKHCLVKQGYKFVAEDLSKRDISDRIAWQRYVHNRLSDLDFIPKELGYFENKETINLVIEYIDGLKLKQFLTQQYESRTWREQSQIEKKRLLTMYFQVVDMVNQIYERGFVHRDISHNNIIISKDESIHIIDLELAYDIKNGNPTPAFTLGTIGYAAPEQFKLKTPTQKEDVYSLGATLGYFLTAVRPPELIDSEIQNTRTRLSERSIENDLIDIIISATNSDPDLRPTLQELRKTISDFVNNL